jgi:D-glycero-D-manno-heptose 1,7-bisphosphate phosphatase
MSARRMSLKDLNIDESWTLFLDRDGVINKKLENNYVKHWIEFDFLENSFEALRILKDKFSRIIIVTNQQGIGKRIYRTEDLEIIHKNMLYEVGYHGGRIDRVYFSPYLESENHPTRKPGIGMALQAKKDFPEIDFSKSLMVGDSMSDMKFGKIAGMYTVMLSEKNIDDPLVDFNFPGLHSFASAL